MLPEGWKETTLERYIHVKHGYAFKGEYFSASGKYIVLTPGNFIESGGFRDQKDKTKYYSGEIPEEYILKKGDCILAMTEQATGLLGSAAFIPDNNKFLHNQRIGLIEITDPHSVSLDFLYWLYNDPKNRLIISNEAGGTKVKHTSPKKLVDISILLPPLPEQKKIAAILSTWDRAIEGTEKLLANSQQQKKALMQQLLTGKKRLPGFTGEWKFHTLSELAAMSSGGTPLSTQKAYFGGNIPWVSIADMTRCGKYISQTEKTLTKSGLDNSSAKLYPKNTVLYAMYASIGECSIASTELSCSQAILGIRTNSKLYFEYLYFYLGFLKEKIKLLGQTGTQSNLNAKMVKAFRINLPPLPEQKAIAAVLSTSDEEITALESDLARLRQEKKALMQQLLTGKIRVAV